MFSFDKLSRVDPFMEYSLFHDSKILYLSHLHEILFSFVFYNIVCNVLAPIINKFVFGVHYTHLKDRKTKLDYDLHTVSMIQCIASYSLMPFVANVPKHLNVATYYDHLSTLTSSLSIGYFLWDVVICLKNYDLSGPAFLVHAIVSLYVSGITLLPMVQPWIGPFLMFEASTPFVNINWYASQISKSAAGQNLPNPVPAWLKISNALILIAIFLFIRIIGGSSATWTMFHQIWEVRDQMYKIPTVIFMTLIVILNCLNVFWFTKMLSIAYATITGKKPASKTKSN